MTTADPRSAWPKLRLFPVPAKVLATAVLCSMAIGLVGALGQILIHDILPTFYKNSPAGHAARSANEAPKADQSSPAGHTAHSAREAPGGNRGDLLADTPSEPRPETSKPFYQSDQFVWTLRWTHIHLFGINMIFIFIGMVTACLDLSSRARTWLIALPFIGVLIDIASMWLKGYVSPHFFWLHLPGGGLFGMVFVFVFIRALYEMWLPSAPADRMQR
jgi:hypothetical protein